MNTTIRRNLFSDTLDLFLSERGRTAIVGVIHAIEGLDLGLQIVAEHETAY